jgi:hypothetical protein
MRRKIIEAIYEYSSDEITPEFAQELAEMDIPDLVDNLISIISYYHNLANSHD